MAHLVSRKELADSFGVDERTISRWKGEGMPPPADGSEYDIEPIIKWWGEREIARRLTSSNGVALDLNAERARHSKEQADKLEMENAKSRGLLMDAGAVAVLWSKIATAAKTRLLAIPSRVAPLLIGKKIAEIKDILETHAYECASAIAGDPLGESLETAAKADGKPVGRREPKVKPGGKRGAG